MLKKDLDALLRPAVELLRRDVAATIGPSSVDIVDEVLAAGCSGREDGESLREWLVENCQQRFHDEWIHTTWPTCPHHPNHPMWYREGWWWCTSTNVRIARLGELR